MRTEQEIREKLAAYKADYDRELEGRALNELIHEYSGEMNALLWVLGEEEDDEEI